MNIYIVKDGDGVKVRGKLAEAREVVRGVASKLGLKVVGVEVRCVKLTEAEARTTVLLALEKGLQAIDGYKADVVDVVVYKAPKAKEAVKEAKAA